MRIFLLLPFFLGSLFSGLSAQETFPDSWSGSYKGELQIYGVDSVKMKVGMQLDIAPTARDSVYSWKIIYNMNGKEDLRAYELHTVDRQKGHYRVDELNSIVLDGYLRAHIFTSFFEVSGAYIIAAYTKEGDSIVFEIISALSEPVSTSGNTKQGEEAIPEVQAYQINGRQKAILRKIE
ncbi:MAG: hypothetical protein KDC56_11495 [Flavobacteriaceae bacterium]|nr:hypothetical protein [Flavobacteriaceae bacterium]